MTLISAGTAALSALIANLALEVAPVRVNLIAAGCAVPAGLTRYRTARRLRSWRAD
jgi:hypothetical protein